MWWKYIRNPQWYLALKYVRDFVKFWPSLDGGRGRILTLGLKALEVVDYLESYFLTERKFS